jgi:hypothetical protein
MLFLGCSKSKVKPGNTDPQTATSPKTAPDNYIKTYTDGTSLLALWKPLSGHNEYYNKYGVLLGVQKVDASSLSQIQFIDTANFQETPGLGPQINGSYYMNAKNDISYINFASDEGYNIYAIDTLSSNKLTITQINKYPEGIPFNLNGANYTAYEWVITANFYK